MFSSEFVWLVFFRWLQWCVHFLSRPAHRSSYGRVSCSRLSRSTRLSKFRLPGTANGRSGGKWKWWSFRDFGLSSRGCCFGHCHLESCKGLLCLRSFYSFVALVIYLSLSVSWFAVLFSHLTIILCFCHRKKQRRSRLKHKRKPWNTAYRWQLLALVLTLYTKECIIIITDITDTAAVQAARAAKRSKSVQESAPQMVCPSCQLSLSGVFVFFKSIWILSVLRFRFF